MRAYLRRLGVPSEILDLIDVEAEWDTTLEPEENLRLLGEKYPQLQPYLPMFKVSYEDMVNEAMDIILDAIGDDPEELRTLLNNLAYLYYTGHNPNKEKEALEEIYLITGIEVSNISEFDLFLVEFIDRIFDRMVDGSFFLPDYDDKARYPTRISAIKQWMKYKGIYQYLGSKFREKRRAPITDKRIREYAIEALKFGSVSEFREYLEKEHPEALERIREAGFKTIGEFYNAAIKSKTIRRWAKQREAEKKEEVEIIVKKPEMDEALKVAFASLGIELLGVGGTIVETTKEGTKTYKIIIIKDESSGLPVEIIYPIPTYIPQGFFMGEITTKEGRVFGFPVRKTAKGIIPEYWASPDSWEGMLRYVSNKIESVLESIEEKKALPLEVRKVLLPESAKQKAREFATFYPIEIKQAYEMFYNGSFIDTYTLIRELYKKIRDMAFEYKPPEETRLTEEQIKELWETFSKVLEENRLLPERYTEEFDKIVSQESFEEAKMVMEDTLTAILIGKSMEKGPPIVISKRHIRKIIIGSLAQLKMKGERAEAFLMKIDSGELDEYEQIKLYNEIIELSLSALNELEELIDVFMKDKDVWRYEH